MSKNKIKIFLFALLAHYSVAFVGLSVFAGAFSFLNFGVGFLITALLGFLILCAAKCAFTKNSLVRTLIQYPDTGKFFVLPAASLVGWAIGVAVGTLVLALVMSTPNRIYVGGLFFMIALYGFIFGGYFGAIFGALYADAAAHVYYRKQKFSFTGAFTAALCGILLHLAMTAFLYLFLQPLFLIFVFGLSLFFSILFYLPITAAIIYAVCKIYQWERK